MAREGAAAGAVLGLLGGGLGWLLAVPESLAHQTAVFCAGPRPRSPDSSL
jgi:hypothetical protein